MSVAMSVGMSVAMSVAMSEAVSVTMSVAMSVCKLDSCLLEAGCWLSETERCSVHTFVLCPSTIAQCLCCMLASLSLPPFTVDHSAKSSLAAYALHC